MDNLLQSSDFLDLVNKHRRDQGTTPPLASLPSLYSEDTNKAVFDIIDINSSSSPGATHIVVPNGKGSASYLNTPSTPPGVIRFIAYESFINSLGDDYNYKWNRADYIAYDTSASKSHFIIHELSIGSFQNKRAKGLAQLQNTLMRLREVDSIKNYMDSFNARWCILSATEGAQQAPFDMTEGFNKIYDELPDPVPLKAGLISNRGFEGWNTLNVKL